MIKEIKPYAFIDRKGNKVTRESYMANRVGKAYGFFDCNASKTEIEGELPTIRDLVKTPSELELSLIEGFNWNSELGRELQTYNEQSKSHERSKVLLGKDLLRMLGANILGCKYFIQATYPNRTDKETADELATILNQAYQSPLYQNGERFKGGIVYKEKGKYILRE